VECGLYKTLCGGRRRRQQLDNSHRPARRRLVGVNNCELTMNEILSVGDAHATPDVSLPSVGTSQALFCHSVTQPNQLPWMVV